MPVWAPAAQTVDLYLPGQDRLVGMIPVPGGWWTAPFDLEPGTDYAFRVDGSPNRPDPRSALQPDGVHGPSRTVDPDTWRWTDQNWAGKDLRGSVIYELHVGTFTPEGTLDAAVSRLGHLVDLGVDIVELMPLAAFPGKAGWGYDGVGLWAVHEAYGGPDALARFVDAAHNAGIGVCLDVVYNHLGPSGNYLSVFGPYFTPAHHTPWGEAVNYDHDGSQQVRAFVIDSALRWMRDFHIDALRLDAIHEIKDDAAAAATPQRHVLAELSDAVAALSIELGRPLSLVAEADLNDVGVITPTSEEPPAKVPSLGMTAQWADDVHHALHVRLTGEDQGYYGDFAEVGAWAKAYGRAFLHNGTWSTFRERNWGAPVPEDTDPRRFVVFGSDHDQVGNRAVGDRPSVILDDAALAATAALVLLSPYTPMLFMGEEWGTRTPFQFFTDHEEDDLARSVSEGRVREFAGFGWDADEIPDPQAAATVEASRLRWSELDEAEHARVLAWYQALTTLRRNLDWSQRTAWPQVDEIDDVLMVTYDDIVVAANLSGQERPAPALSTVLLSWDPFDAAAPSLSPGQTLIARR
ncbi:malto-oligosyltrehalose trehalohydrolase [Actinomyces naeslundii]|uniref:Malto-oligosyltrehalose trehalohydrolase n=1 Tax=Actinomyces naeslundii (strain ATCC 12104 / DSM 43013 / CCUG 2238 / JCM 8349 / NCTC 10301 / Howell 279) TaxID=1115803 RepID=J2ZM01_ACTNH|nr:malto-oligosyltrehalose trehalohydrolase [Actinomyces naeslundii]EJN83510.1 4-alpha-D-((1->4)-alpha-D-glucano)trehalose trehalohydrolase [Actinomyces naeslundii str. Howell 279]